MDLKVLRICSRTMKWHCGPKSGQSVAFQPNVNYFVQISNLILCLNLRVISGSDIIEVASFDGVWSVHLIKFKALNFSLKKIIFQNMERKNTKTVGKWDSKWPRSPKRNETDLTRKILISKCKGFQDIACICLIFEVIQAMGDGYILFNFQSNSNNAMSGKLNAVFWSADQNLN